MSRFFGWLPHSAAARIGRQGLIRSVLSRPDSPERSGAVWNRRRRRCGPQEGTPARPEQPREAAGPVPAETVVDFIDPEVGQPPPPDEKAPL